MYANKKVEELQSGVWREVDDFPFANTYLSLYSMVTFNRELYLFGMFVTLNLVKLYLIFILGGYGNSNYLTLAVKYGGSGKWSEVGELLKPRYSHRSIVIDNTIMHIGGYSKSSGDLLVIKRLNYLFKIYFILDTSSGGLQTARLLM